MAGKRRRSHKSSKVTDSEFDSKRYIGNTLSQRSSNYSVPLTSKLSEVSTSVAPKVIGTQGSHLPTFISSEIPRVNLIPHRIFGTSMEFSAYDVGSPNFAGRP
ncbi:unnamed protein product [Trichobilharzia regenti]|nr:unnamed protein product [Trichobilharzia regenti]